MNKPELQVHALIDFGVEQLLLGALHHTASNPISVGEIKGGLMPEYLEKANILNTSSMVTRASEDGKVTFLAAMLAPMTGTLVSRALAVQLQNRAKVFATVMVENGESMDANQALKKIEPYQALVEKLLANPATASKGLTAFYARVKAVAMYARNPFLGKFDNVENGIAGGWVINLLNPDERCEVHIMDGMHIVGYGVADFFREDLLQAQKLDGRVAFRIPLPNSIYDGKEHALAIRVKGRKDLLAAGVVRFKGAVRQSKKMLLQPAVRWHLLEQLLSTIQDGELWLAVFEIYQKSFIDLERGEYTSAILHLQELLGKGIDSSPVQLALIQIDLLRESHADAAPKLQALLATDSANPLVNYVAAVVHKALGQVALSVDFLEKALKGKAMLLDCAKEAESLYDELTDLAIDDVNVAKDKKLERLRRQLLKHPDNADVSARIEQLLSDKPANLARPNSLIQPDEDTQTLLNKARHQRILMDTLVSTLKGSSS